MSKEPNKPEAPGRIPMAGSDRFEEARAHDADIQQLHDALIREKQEPTERFVPMPLFLVLLISGLAFWAGIYLVKYSAGFDRFAYNEEVDPNAALLAAAAAGPREFDPMAAGARFFQRNCTVCHQGDGKGVPGVYPPLASSDWVAGAPELSIKILLFGMQGPIQVNGTSFNGVMPTFAHASDRDIAAVLTVLRTAPEYGNNAEPVTEEQVAAIRSEYAGRSAAWQGSELEQMYLQQ